MRSTPVDIWLEHVPLAEQRGLGSCFAEAPSMTLEAQVLPARIEISSTRTFSMVRRDMPPDILGFGWARIPAPRM